MKIDFKKILKKKKIFSIKKNNHINPHRGWRILVWVALLSGFLLIIFSFYIFSQIKKDQIFKIEQTEEIQKETIKEDKLDKILKSFEEKEKKRNMILSGEVNFKDPS